MVVKTMPFTPEVLLSAPRRSAGVPNPTGTKVLYTTSTYSFKTHKKDTELRVLDAVTGESHLLAHNEDISDMNWIDDDQFVYLHGVKDGGSKICIARLSTALQSTLKFEVVGKIDAPAANLKIAKFLLGGQEFGIVVSATADPDGILWDPEKGNKSRSTGRLYTKLYVRHWDHYQTKYKNALWFAKVFRGSDGKWQMTKLRNLLKGTGLECPIQPFGGTDNFDVSEKAIIFVAKDPDLNPALNVKCNVYLMPIKSWEEEQSGLLQVIVPGFEGASTSPVISTDGKKAAFLCMATPGYEADKNQIFVLPIVGDWNKAPEPIRLCAIGGDQQGSWDSNPSSICFSPDGENLYAIAEDYGKSKLFMMRTDLSQKQAYCLTNNGSVSDMKCLTSGNIFISGSSIVDNSFFAVVVPITPPELGSLAAEDRVTWVNSNSANGNKFGLASTQVSWIWTPASNPKILKEIASLVVKPSNFDAGKKYPVAYLIHGGPQSSWLESWSTRWNPAVFAEQGYIVICPNPTGSTGYGQNFTDAIRNNWGGDPYQDIVNVFEWVGKNMPSADNERAVALGASYGGYMMNWIQGHDLGRRFKCIVCHDGITSFAGGLLSTEELYFPFHDLGGTPWYDPNSSANRSKGPAAEAHHNFGASMFSDWRKWDPSEHFANWATPQLIIHSSKDYRLPIAEGLAAFNVLQARGVESAFLTFPDENHWVLKPENSLVWHKVVLNWINKYAGLPRYTDVGPENEDFWGGVRDEKEEVVTMMTQGQPAM